MSVRAALRSLPLLVAAAAVLSVAAPAAAEPGFGTAPVAADPPAPGWPVTISSVTVGRHADFDRVVFALSGPTVGYRAQYVPKLIQDGSGNTVPIAGKAILVIIVQMTDWTEHPSPSVNRTLGWEGMVQLRSVGEFEGIAQFGIGQASKAGFRVQRLTGPDRLVVDVRHPARTAPAPSASASAAPAATSPSAAATTSPAPAAVAGELPDTGSGTNPLPLAILGAALALVGIVAVTFGVRLTRRPA